MLKDWNYMTPITDILKRTISPTRRIIYEGESASRNSDTKCARRLCPKIYTRWERAQELRVDEFSVQKLRESHDTIQRLTSKMQEMQEQMNSVNDSGEFQEMESNHSGKISYVPSQQAVILSPRSMLSREKKRLPLDTWNLSESQGNVFGHPRPMFDSSQTPYRGFLHSTTPSATGAVPVQVSTGTLVARGEERIGSTTAMPMSERRPSTMNSFLPVEVPQN